MNEHLEKALAALQAARDGENSPDTLLEIARTQASIATAELLQEIRDHLLSDGGLSAEDDLIAGLSEEDIELLNAKDDLTAG